MLKIRLIFAAALAALTLHAAQPERRVLTVLHTSDLHGSVLPVDDSRGRGIDHSLAQIASLVDEVRRTTEHEVLLVDSGDTIQGTPFELFTTVRRGRPSPTIAAMNRIGYLAMAVGNHEYNFGLDVLRRAEAEAAFPFLSANTIDLASGDPAFEPYLITEADGVRIGILGLTTPNIPNWERPEHYSGLGFEPMHDAARRWVGKLRGDLDCDLVVVLAHTGFERDLETGLSTGTESEDFGWRLTEVPGIDLLLTGHAHDDIAPRRIGSAIVSQPWAFARIVTRIDLELVREGDDWAIEAWTGANIPVRDFPAAPEFAEGFAEDHRRVAEQLDRTLVDLEDGLDVRGCRIRDCAALDLIHEVQLEATGAELSLAAILNDTTPALAAGPLNWRWIYGFYPYPNTLVAVRVTGAQVKDILEHSALYYSGLDCSTGEGCTVLSNPDVARYNVDTMAGVTYRVDPTRAAGERILDLEFEGRPIDLHRTFTLACNNYRAAGGGGFPHLASAAVVWTSATELTELIGAHLETKSVWKPEADGNWRIAPEMTEK